MKRSDIKITLDHRISECSRELKMRKQVYGRQILDNKLSTYQANKRMLIILQYKELCEFLKAKSISWDQLIEHLQELEISKARAQQSTFQFPS